MTGEQKVKAFLKKFDKDCKFCELYNGNENVRIELFRGNSYMIMNLHNYKIKYCPECGRKL